MAGHIIDYHGVLHAPGGPGALYASRQAEAHLMGRFSRHLSVDITRILGIKHTAL